MAGETQIAVVGNLVADPEIRFTPSGSAVANFTVASTPRAFDKATNKWRDGEPLFLRCSLWGDPAEHMVESLFKGARVIVLGNLTQRAYTTSEGEKRTVVEVKVNEVGPSMRYASCKVQKATRSEGSAARDDWASDAPF